MIQYNDAGAFGAEAGFAYNAATDTLTAVNATFVNIDNAAIGETTPSYATFTTLRANDATFTALAVSTNTLYVDPNTNNVGIGTTSPSFNANAKGLDIAGTGGILNNPQDGTERIPTLRITDLVTDYGSGTATIGEIRGAIEFYQSETSSNMPAVVGSVKSVNEGTTNTLFGLSFYTNENTATPTERMRIDNTGNVGIGAISPEHKLHVAGTLTATDATFETINNAKIGNTTPGRATFTVLHVNQDATFTDATVATEVYGASWDGVNTVPTKDAVYDKIQALGGNIAGSSSMIQYNDAGSFGAEGGFAYNATSNTFTAPNATFENIGATTAGHGTFVSLNVGTSLSSSNPLRVTTTSSSRGASIYYDGPRVGNAFGPMLALSSRDASHGYVITQDAGISAGDSFAIANNGSPYTRYLVINQNGLVGIGTTLPQHKLQVVGSMTATDATFATLSSAWATFTQIGATTPGRATFTVLHVNQDATFTDLTVATEAYDATNWDSDNTVPTKDAVRDKIESIAGASVAGSSSMIQYNDAGSFGAEAGFAYNVATDTLTAVNATFVNIDNAAIGETTPSFATFTTLNANDATFTALAVDTNTLYADPNSGNVGIGTTTPGQLLVLSSSSPRIELRDSGDSNNLRVDLGDSSGSGGFLRMYNESEVVGTFLSSYADSYLRGGNLGIGVAAPEHKLHVAGTLTATDATFETINNAKIGNTTPGRATFTVLHVNQDATFTDATVATEVYGASWDGVNTVPTKDAVYDKVEALGGGIAGSSSMIQYNDAGAFGAEAGFAYNVATDTLTAVNATFVNIDNAAIGETTPSFATFTTLNANDATFTALAVDTNVLYVDPNGNNVGIGTTSPQQALHVVGGVFPLKLERSGQNPALEVGFVGGVMSGDGLDVVFQPDSVDSMGYAFKYSSGASQGIFGFGMDDSGNVGIGVIAPEHKLHVAGTLTATDATFETINNAKIGNTTPGRATFTVLHVNQDATFTDATVATEVYGASWDGVNTVPTKDAVYDKVEALGGGIAGSSSMIQYNDAGAFGAEAGFAYNASTDTLTAVNATFTTINNAKIGNTTPADATFTSLQLTTGNIGIGTTTPEDKLEVYEGDIKLGDHSNTAYGIDFERNGNLIGKVDTANARFTFTTQNGNDFEIKDGAGNSFMYIDDTGTVGNVGMGGVTAPEKTLHVAGTLTATDATFETINNAKIGNTTPGRATFTVLHVNQDATFTDATVTAEAYGASWDGVNTVPTKDAVYDKVQALGGGIAGSSSMIQYNDAGAFGAEAGFAYNAATDTLTAVNATFDNINGTMIGATTASSATFTTLSATDATFSGKVGIGTTTPVESLDVMGAVMATAQGKIASPGEGIVIDYIPASNTGRLQVGDWGTAYEPLDIQAETIRILSGTGGATLGFYQDTFGNVGIGVSAPEKTLHVAGTLTATDATFETINNAKIGNTTPGRATFTVLHVNQDATFTDATVTAEAYGASWDGVNTVPTKDAVYDKVQALGGGIAGSSSMIQYNDAGAFGAEAGFAYNASTDTFTAANATFSGTVSVGIYTPDGTLHVHSGSAGAVTANASMNDLVVENSDHGGVSVLTPSSKIGYYGFGNEGDDFVGGMLYVHSNDALHLYTANAEVMRINSSGNIGFGGVTAPSHKLHVAGTLTATDATFETINNAKIGGTTPSDATFTAVNVTTGNVGIGTLVPESDYAILDGPILEISGPQNPALVIDDTGQTLNYTFVGQSDDLDIYYGNTLLMALQNNGNIGIGVTDPDTKLEIIGGVTAVDATFSGNVGIGTTEPEKSLHVKSSGEALAQVESTAGASFAGLHIDATGDDWYLQSAGNNDRFEIRSEGAGNEYLVIQRAAGNVGIGVAAPEHKLHVAGTLTATDATFETINNSIIGNTTAADATFNAATVDAEAYGATWDGRNTVPTKDAVYDQIETLGGAISGTNQMIQYNNAGAFGAEAGFAYNASTDTLTAVNATFTTINNAKIGGTTAADASFTALAVDTNTLVADPNTNNIGIGTTAPMDEVHIYRSAGDADLRVETDGGGAGSDEAKLILDSASSDTRIIFNDTGTTRWAIGTDYATDDFYFGEDDSDPTATPRLVLQEGGNVGIGVTDPDADLEVVGTLHVSGKITSDTGVDPPYVSFTEETYDSIREYSEDVVEHEKVMIFWNKDNQRMELYDIENDRFFNIYSSSNDGLEVLSGNVGIGTSAPIQKLHINGVAQLDPTDSPGTCTDSTKGSIYMDDSISKPCFCDGTTWSQFDGSPCT